MSISEDALRRYVEQTSGPGVSDASITRMTNACSIAGEGLQALASESLFDTEPEQLHSVLESLADREISSA